jgi:predicted P-loop ATPase
VAEERDQLWAEAVVRWQRGEKWFALNDAEIQTLIRRQQQSRLTPDDPWKLIVERWLKCPTIPTEGGLHGERSVVDVANGFCGEDVLMGAIGVQKHSLTPAMASRMGHVLKSVGYQHRQRRVSGRDEREWVYLPAGEPTDE